MKSGKSHRPFPHSMVKFYCVSVSGNCRFSPPVRKKIAFCTERARTWFPEFQWKGDTLRSFHFRDSESPETTLRIVYGKNASSNTIIPAIKAATLYFFLLTLLSEFLLFLHQPFCSSLLCLYDARGSVFFQETYVKTVFSYVDYLLIHCVKRQGFFQKTVRNRGKSGFIWFQD